MNGMFNSTTLDVMAGLIFVYLLLAIMCSSINEWVAGMLKLRGATLGRNTGTDGTFPDYAIPIWECRGPCPAAKTHDVVSRRKLFC
jgi:hypothetical protein